MFNGLAQKVKIDEILPYDNSSIMYLLSLVKYIF